MKTLKLIGFVMIIEFLLSCADKTPEYKSFEDYPTTNESLWLNYSREASEFKIWSPTADQVQLHLYTSGIGGEPIASYTMKKGSEGVWTLKLDGDLNGKYYTYQVKIKGKVLEETPGIYAQTVGLNGTRAMVLDLENTNPDNWKSDKGPSLAFPNEAVIYEMHIRDFTIQPESGVKMKGKYLGLTEEGTEGPEGVATGIDHLKELGVTHVHLLPIADFPYVDESKIDAPQYNWGYGPLHYNVPEGFYSTDPSKGDVRVKEFKAMVKALHDNGIGVILDVVYNHTALFETSNFNLESPNYYYRFSEDGKPSNASACGNETASERTMMRKFMIESVSYWAKEYHIDGFRFDLMGIHDIETMNEISKTLKAINPNSLIYGEGWTAGDSPFPPEQRAFKVLTNKMPDVAAFSDEIRDGLKGPWNDIEGPGFVSGKDGLEESVKMGIVGCIEHPQVDYSQVNTSKAPWANQPWQSILYVSCHDNNTLYDKLKISRPDASEQELIAMDKLAQAVVFTSQGISFIHSGAELLRTKQGVENSYESPDSINQINWNWKVAHANVLDYYKNLIKLRKEHPAFRMTSASEVQKNLEFKTVEKGLISYQISNNANGDSWKNIYVIYNAQPKAVNYKITGTWNVAVMDDNFKVNKTVKNSVNVPAISMAILYQE